MSGYDMSYDYVIPKYNQYVDPSNPSRHDMKSNGGMYWQEAQPVQVYDQDIERIEREIENNERWEVHHIVSKRYTNGKPEFLVYWKGYSKPSWEPAEVLDNCQDIINEFNQLCQDMGVNNPDSKRSRADPKGEIKRIDQFRECYYSIKFDDSIYEKVILGRGSGPAHAGPMIEELEFDEIETSNKDE